MTYSTRCQIRVMEQVPPELVQRWLSSGKTYQQISVEIKHLYPSVVCGLSSRSVRCYVAQLDLKSAARHDLDEIVQEAVAEVGMHAVDLYEMP